MLLTPALAQKRATDLRPTPDGSSFAFTRLRVTELGLCGLHSSSLSEVPFLTELDISNNALTSLKGLEAARFLRRLIASSNRLARLLDFPPPAGSPAGSALILADLRHNLIRGALENEADGECAGVAAHTQLEELYLDGNQLSSGLSGLAKLKCLRRLSMRANLLRCEAIEVGALPLASLTSLDLSENQLTNLAEVLRKIAPPSHHPFQLRHLSLAHNPLDVELGHGVNASTVVCWGFEDVETTIHRAYLAQIQRALPSLSSIDEVVLDVQPSFTH